MVAEFKQALQQFSTAGARGDSEAAAVEAREEATANANARAAAAKARGRREAEARRLANGGSDDDDDAATRPPPPPPAAVAPPPPVVAPPAAAAPSPPAAAPSPPAKRAPNLEAAAQIAARVGQSAAAAASPIPTAKPRTTSDFERTWRALWKAGGPATNGEALRALLALLPPDEMAPLFGESLSDSTLETLVLGARALYLPERAPDALALLCGLARVRRFDVLWMFAGDEAKRAALDVLAAVAPPAPPFDEFDMARARKAFA
jgi:hypothetical protein